MRKALRPLVVLIACYAGQGIQAKIVEIEVTSRETFAGGMAFGAAGSYERLTGTARGEVDPSDPRNAGIVNLDKASRNASDKVEYETDFFILRPRDPAKANGAILYEVNNRGLKLLASAIMGAVPNPRNPMSVMSDPRAAEDVGDGLLLQLGYTLVWSGWDPNASRAQGGLAMNAPVALENGKPIERVIRDEFSSSPLMIASPQFRLSYEAASLDDKDATLTMRWRESEPGKPLPRTGWRFVDARTVELLPQGTRPQAGALYELHYRAKAPQVAGLGFAATRDFVSHLRRAPDRSLHGGLPSVASAAGAGAQEGPPDSPTPKISRTMALGISQSARFLRAFVAEGFNRDAAGERVFDGVLAHIGGAGKVFLNAEFSQPSRTNTQFSDHFFPDFEFPYSTARLPNPFGPGEAGILAGDASDPLFVQMNTSTEYWQKAASLISTDPQSAKDIAQPENSRTYFLTGLPHAPLGQAQGDVVHPVNMLTSTFILRALLLRLDDWLVRGTPMPRSVLPRIDRETLVRRADVRFPAIPGVALPTPNSAQRIADWIAPRVASGAQPLVLVPQADADGQDLGGLRVPEVAVPLGTALGWNLYRGQERAGQMASLVGSFIPFAKTKAERLADKDPRLSLEERYADKADYVAKFRKAVDTLVEQGFVRPEDAAHYADRAIKTKAFE